MKRDELKEGGEPLMVNIIVRNRVVTLAAVPTKSNKIAVGYSILNPSDKFDPMLAEKISIGRALKESSRIGESSVTEPHLVDSTDVKEFILRDAMSKVSKNPERYISAFTRIKEKPFDFARQFQEAIEEM